MTTPSIPSIPYGYCHCGCGNKTTVPNENNPSVGYIKGVPMRYLRGHSRTKPRFDFSDAVPFKIEGVYCKLIDLTKGHFAIVDAEDHLSLSAFNWLPAWSGTKKAYYATRMQKKEEGRSVNILMHRQILGLSPEDTRTGDHIDADGSTLDNRRRNLRIATNQEQQHNKRRPSNNTSGYKGVHLHAQSGKWRAVIGVDGGDKSLGLFATKEEAHAAYCAAAKKYHGEFAKTV